MLSWCSQSLLLKGLHRCEWQIWTTEEREISRTQHDLSLSAEKNTTLLMLVEKLHLKSWFMILKKQQNIYSLKSLVRKELSLHSHCRSLKEEVCSDLRGLYIQHQGPIDTIIVDVKIDVLLFQTQHHEQWSHEKILKKGHHLFGAMMSHALMFIFPPDFPK